MKVDQNTPKRRALKYYGGKWNLAPWIISYFPEHKHYVEPCGGAASVLLQKTRSFVETYNDIDGVVVNFFRVLRNNPEDLLRAIRLTPWSREEYDTCFFDDTGDDLERARKFFMAQWMGIGAATTRRNLHFYGWRCETKKVKGRIENDIDLIQSDNLLGVAERLKYVQIEKYDALDIIPKYDSQESLIYFDPPYVGETRTDTSAYSVDCDDDFHRKAAELLRECDGYVVVSGYACSLYGELYEEHGWIRFDKESNNVKHVKRVDSVWLSPKTQFALSSSGQISMF